MSGLDKITEHIISKATQEANAIIADAKSNADNIVAEAKSSIKAYEESENQRITAECDKIIQMAESENRQRTRQAILSAKSSAISQIIEDTKSMIKGMSGDEYKKILITILKKSITGEAGEIVFSKKDKEIIDEAFTQEIKTASDGKLIISDHFCNIDSGFIIKYGKIEINCSIDSIFEEKYNELTDIVNSFLINQ